MFTGLLNNSNGVHTGYFGATVDGTLVYRRVLYLAITGTLVANECFEVPYLAVAKRFPDHIITLIIYLII